MSLGQKVFRNISCEPCTIFTTQQVGEVYGDVVTACDFQKKTVGVRQGHSTPRFVECSSAGCRCWIGGCKSKMAPPLFAGCRRHTGGLDYISLSKKLFLEK